MSKNSNLLVSGRKTFNKEDDQVFALRMIMLGIPLDEPHLKDQLSILLKTQRNDLKAGKLLVTESYYLLGTVDPTGKLKQNEVCVILEAGQISGDVLVYRNPGLHFGDIHVLKATYVKALEEHVGNSKYGVFFPQIGPRSLGDEIAGGDFDGDMYFISRNPNGTTNYSPLSIAFGSNLTFYEPFLFSYSNTSSQVNHGLALLLLVEFMLVQRQVNLHQKCWKRSFSECFWRQDLIPGAAADSWLTIMDRYLTLGDERAKEKAGMKRQILKAIDIYYDALDAPKNGAKVYLPLDLKFESFPHYMEYKHKKSFNSTSILGLIYDTVVSQNEEEPPPCGTHHLLCHISEIKKLPCFEDELVPESHMEKWGGCEVIKKYKQNQCNGFYKQLICGTVSSQEFYGGAEFKDIKRNLDAFYPQALALYNIVYDYAILKNNVRYCGFVWRVAGRVLCDFYFEKKVDGEGEESFSAAGSVVKKLYG
ncbi:hypothetical protein HID58_088374 [Brassica napus]|uniref:RNA-dependent RNA polymerase n=1 Tax=Brassica napus TaxID=3708 RepID=A0ABQ7XYL6_BRANA|nr:hypothetical protein HID58_088374 [Brassica napus]